MSIFYNATEARARAGWRILIFILMFWLLSASIFIVRPLLGDVGRREFLEDYSLLVVAILALSSSIAVPVARKFLDKKSLSSLGLQLNSQTWKDLLFGFVLSAGMAGLFFMICFIFGWIEFNGFSSTEPQPQAGFVSFMKVLSAGTLLLLLLEHMLVGYWEELVFRGYLFQNLIQGLRPLTAIVVSCVLYGLLHAANPNATLLSTVIIVLFGYLRIYGYLSSKQLWLSMGMHMGWNFFQGPIFGFGASGHQMTTLLDIEPSGPDWLSGGNFGPEGSLIIVPILILALLAMRWWTGRQGG